MVQLKLNVSKFVIRSLSVSNSNREEILIDCNLDYPSKAREIPYLLPIRNYVSAIFEACHINLNGIKTPPLFPTIPSWEHLDANIDIDFTLTRKSENINQLVSDVVR